MVKIKHFNLLWFFAFKVEAKYGMVDLNENTSATLGII